MDFNHTFNSILSFLVILVIDLNICKAQYQAPRRPNYGGPVNVYKPVYGSGGSISSSGTFHNSLHTPMVAGYKGGSRLPIVPIGKGYPKYYPKGKTQKVKKVLKSQTNIVNSKTNIVKSKTNVNVKKEQPVTVVFNRPKPVIVLDRRPVINFIKKVDKDKGGKQNIDLIGTVGQATNQRTIDVNNARQFSANRGGGAKVAFSGGNAVGGGATVKGGNFHVDIVNKIPAGVFQRPGLMEAAMAAAGNVGGMGQAVDVGLVGPGQDIGLGVMGSIDLGAGPLTSGLSAADALALTSAVARLEQKISGMQHNVNINNNNNNNNLNVNDNNHGGFDNQMMDQMMMAMMLNGGELSDAMMDSMTSKLTGVGGGGSAGGGSGGGGSGSSGGGGSGGTKIKINPENSTGKSVILKVDGNVQISKSNILSQ